MSSKTTTENLEITEEFDKALNVLLHTDESIFITGKAGTGKSSLLRHFTNTTDKKYIVLAPTGIAALNVGGQTIHSFFRFPPGEINPKSIKFDYMREDLFEQLEMVIIDEVSMVRSDLMNGIDVSLRMNTGNDIPFGGVQMVFIGDMFQLPPVIRNQERHKILNEYGGEYFFDAPVFSENFHYHFLELTKVFRQSEEEAEFIEILNRVRSNAVTDNDIKKLNSRYNPSSDNSGIYLTSRRNTAREINNARLIELEGESKEFIGELKGKYEELANEDEKRLESKLPAPYKLNLKEGAQVMMLKNDPLKRWVNGTIATVISLKDNEITISIDGKTDKLDKEIWMEVKYFYNRESGEIEEEVVAEFIQYPVRLSYAVTIHKSQGKTFDNVTIDVGRGAFAHGQMYVALSRCTTLEGITLKRPIRKSDIITDRRIASFYKNMGVVVEESEVPDSVEGIVKKAVDENRRIKLTYVKEDGAKTTRTVSNLRIVTTNDHLGDLQDFVKGYCHLRKEMRFFNMERIEHAEIV